MMRTLVYLLLTVLLDANAHAQPLSCDRFKVKLAAAIKEGGNLVAQPWGWSPSNRDKTRQEFRGITSLYGSMQCINDRFFAFGATAKLDSLDKQENVDRESRLIALGAATMCALEAVASRSCVEAARQIEHQAVRELIASKHRGDEPAAGVGQWDLIRSGADLQFDADDNRTVTFSLNVAPKDSVEDLQR